MKTNDLKKVAKELNELLFNPDEKEQGWIKIVGVSNEQLMEDIKKASLLLEKGELEEMSETAQEVINELNSGETTPSDEEKEEEKPAKKEKGGKKEKKQPEPDEDEDEEEEPVKKKASEKPAKKEKLEKEQKNNKKEQPAHLKKDFSGSNKAQVYRAWKKGETDLEKLSKVVKGAVKETTIKGWLGSWNKGKNLPAIQDL